MRFNRRTFIQSAVAGLLLPLVEPIIEPERRIWALGVIPEPAPDPVIYSYTWTWDARHLPPSAFTIGPPPDEVLTQVAPTIDYEDLAYVMCRLFGNPTKQLVSAATDLLWTLE